MAQLTAGMHGWQLDHKDLTGDWLPVLARAVVGPIKTIIDGRGLANDEQGREGGTQDGPKKMHGRGSGRQRRSSTCTKAQFKSLLCRPTTARRLHFSSAAAATFPAFAALGQHPDDAVGQDRKSVV